MLTTNPGEQPKKIMGMCGAPVLEQLFTETGFEPIEWEQISDAVHKDVGSPGVEGGEGFWVDCNLYVRPEKLSQSIEQMQQYLPEEVRSGLNWSPETTYYFLVSVLQVPERDEPTEEGHDSSEETFDDEALRDEKSRSQEQCPFPELVEKRVVVVVRARNAVVAAWLWRKYALDTPLAASPLRVDPWCGAYHADTEVQR